MKIQYIIPGITTPQKDPVDRKYDRGVILQESAATTHCEAFPTMEGSAATRCPTPRN